MSVNEYISNILCTMLFNYLMPFLYQIIYCIPKTFKDKTAHILLAFISVLFL